jgi:hypothetical protein
MIVARPSNVYAMRGSAAKGGKTCAYESSKERQDLRIVTRIALAQSGKSVPERDDICAVGQTAAAH